MRKLLVMVSSVVLAESIFFSVLAPVVPHYQHTFGLSTLQVGALVGSYAAGGLIGALPGGLLASRVGVKITVLLGLGLLSSLSVVFGLARSPWLLDLARVGQGVGGALAWAAALTWLVNESPQQRRGELIGIATAAAAAGALLGPVVGAVATIVGTRPTFTGLALLVLALAIWVMHAPDSGRRGDQPLTSLLSLIRRPGVAIGFWLLALPSLMLGVLGVLAPVRLGKLGVSGSAIGAVFLVGAALQVGTSTAVGRWSDRGGRAAPLRASLLLLTAASLVLPLAASDWSLAVFVVLAAAACGAFFAPATALLTDEAEEAGVEQALTFGLLNVAYAPGSLIGAIGGGALATITGDATPYLLVALLCVMTLGVLTRLLPSARPRVF
jgi:MFS family permease